MFIVFEGIDGSGKGTQVELLKNYLENNGLKVWVTKEPTDSPIGTLIREIQKGNLIENPREDTMLYLYTADRAEHQKEIKEHLAEGDIVICDRYKYSNFAYQWFNTDHARPWDINENFIVPDVCIVLDITAEEAIKRIDNRGESKEIFEKKEFLDKVREKYITLANCVDNVIVIDGTKDTNEVFEGIKKKLKI